MKENMKKTLRVLAALEVAEQIAAQVDGIPGGTLRVPGENAIPVCR